MTMKQKELVSLSKEELTSKLSQEQELLKKLRFAHSISPIENPMKVRLTKRFIARIQTELNRRNIG